MILAMLRFTAFLWHFLPTNIRAIRYGLAIGGYWQRVVSATQPINLHAWPATVNKADSRCLANYLRGVTAMAACRRWSSVSRATVNLQCRPNDCHSRTLIRHLTYRLVT